MFTNPFGSEQIYCPNVGMIVGHCYLRQEFDSTSTITRTIHQAIAEGALLRLEISPPEGVTRGVYLRLMTSANGRMNQPIGTRVSFKTGLSCIRVLHATYAIRPKTLTDRKSGRNKKIIASSKIDFDSRRTPNRPSRATKKAKSEPILDSSS